MRTKNNITNEKVIAFIDELYKPLTPELGALRKSAEERIVPIITKDSETLLEALVRIQKTESVLEIGTAIGYSAIFFASLSSDIKVTTLEFSEKMAAEAINNIANWNFSERISVLEGDALETLKGIEGKFDLIFIDAAKGHYKEFFELCLKNVSPRSIIVSDNILYKGITASEDFLTGRRNKTIMRRMRDYLSYITNLDFVTTSVLPVGDGVAISYVK